MFVTTTARVHMSCKIMIKPRTPAVSAKVNFKADRFRVHGCEKRPTAQAASARVRRLRLYTLTCAVHSRSENLELRLSPKRATRVCIVH